jgi:uncharacterized protein YbjT (DUF2867 family)
MKLFVLGGTGKVGRLVVEQALEAGHQVTVVGRDPQRLGSLTGRVEFAQGDATDPATLDRMAGSEAVISTLSADRSRAPDTMTRAMRETVKAMSRHGIKRIVILTNTSAQAPDDRPTVIQRLIRSVLELKLGRINDDHRGQAKVLLESDLDWTIVRAPRLVDRPRSGRVQIGNLDSSAHISIGRAELAACILRCAVGGEHVREMPLVSS